MLYIDLTGFMCCTLILQVLHGVHLFDRFYVLCIDLTGFICCAFHRFYMLYIDLIDFACCTLI